MDEVVVDQSARDTRRSRAATRSRRRRPGVLEPAPDRVAKRDRVAGRNEQAGPSSVGAMAQSLRHAADVGGDDGQPARERLRDDHPVGLGARREDQHVRRRVAAGEISVCLRAQEAHAAVHPGVEDAAAQPFHEGRVAFEAADAVALPATARQWRERVEEQVVTLAGDHRSNREQRPGGCRPRRELGGIDPGFGDVDAVARQ